MPRMPRVTGRQMIRALVTAGFSIVRQTGSHIHLAHPDRAGIVTVPVHAGETLGPSLVSSILKQAGMSVEELLRHL